MSQNVIYVQPMANNPNFINQQIIVQSNPVVNRGYQSMKQGQVIMLPGQTVIHTGQPNQYGGQTILQTSHPYDYGGQPMIPSSHQVVFAIQSNANNPVTGHPDNTIQWMPRPNIPNCPVGLEYLTQIDQVVIHQKVELFEVMTGFETNNRYIVKNIFGQTIFNAKEETHCLARYVFGANRPFVIHLTDIMDQEIIQIKRSLTCTCIGQCLSFAEFCQDEVEVEAPPGHIVGYVKQLYEGCEVRYAILNENHEIVLRLHGPNYFKCYCPGDDYPLELLSADGSARLGKVSKQWSNLVKEIFTNADNFGVQFPMDLDVKIKAVIIGSVFLIDFMYFENRRNNNRRF